jgi:Domain of unknown function (DUF1772)
MIILFEIFQVLSVFLLGLLAGALWAEGALLVPYWKTLSAQEFYRLHPEYAPRLFRFYAPITITAPITALLVAVMSFWINDNAKGLFILSALLANSLIAIYFIYFRDTNAAFSRAIIAIELLPQELERWGNWHRVRVCICVLAFFTSICAIFITGAI